VLDCLPPFVRKFWSPPLVAWKYVTTSGQEFFSYGALGRSVCASQVNKIIHSGCACFCFPSFVDSHHGHVISTNLNILSRPNLIELFSRGTKFKSGFLSMLSIEKAHLSALFTKVSQLQDENQMGFSSWLTNHHLCHHCRTTANPLCTLNMLRKVAKQTCLL
jgi:hypothetical protein